MRKLDALAERVDGIANQRSSPHAERIEELREGLERKIENLRQDVAALTRQSSQGNSIATDLLFRHDAPSSDLDESILELNRVTECAVTAARSNEISGKTEPLPPPPVAAAQTALDAARAAADDASDVDHDLIRHPTQRVMAMLSQESSPAPSPPPGPRLDGSGPRVTIGADPYALARGLERSNSGEISPGRPVSDEPRTWRSRSSITNETPLFTPQSTRTWSDDDCLSPRSMPEPPSRSETTPSPPRVPVRVRELSFRRPSLNRLASLEEDDEEAEQSPPPTVIPVRFDSTDVANIDDDEASPPEGTGINALDSTVADLDDEGAINALGDTPDLAQGVSPPPSSAAESDAADPGDEACTSSAEEGDPTEPTDAAVDDGSTLQRVNDSLDDGSTLQRGDDEASGSSSSEEGDEPTDCAVDDGSTVRHRLTNDAGSGTDDDSTASTAFDTAVEALSPDGLSPQDSKVATRSPSLSPVPGSPPAGLTLRELATTPTREWPAPQPAPSSFIAAANAATPAPLSSDGSAAAADPEALTPASPASSGGGRVISSADGMAPFGEPDPSPPAGVYSATLSSMPPPPPRSWLSPVRSPVASRPVRSPVASRPNPPRRYLTPPRTRAASPPRTRYDFQSPQPSDARFAAQFRAAATASANGKKGELRRMRDEYAALKRDLADKKSRR
jgi:hypothetical protein